MIRWREVVEWMKVTGDESRGRDSNGIRGYPYPLDLLNQQSGNPGMTIGGEEKERPKKEAMSYSQGY